MKNSTNIYSEIDSYLSAYFGDTDYFCCVYGSYPSKRFTSKSDIDLFVAIQEPKAEDFANIKNYILNLHRSHGMKQDEEVPYENKLLVSYSDVEKAVTLSPFKKSGDEYIIPKIEKSESFLSSSHIRERLIFNALTSPHDCISGNVAKYLSYKEVAEKNLYKLARFITGKKAVSLELLISILLKSEDGREGELYLGYKSFDTIRGYLKFTISKYHD